MGLINKLATTAAAVLVSTGLAFAQEPEETAREELERNRADLQTRESVEEYAGGYIPFEQVLAAPEDVQLNLAYARQQIAQGDLKEGGAALERILLLNPSLHDVRVLYGFVLYRLGLYDRARFELEQALASDKLSPTLRAETETYLKRIQRVQRRTRGSLTVTAGAEYDHNRNQAPSSGQILFLDIPLTATPRNGDAAYVASVQGRLVHDLGSQAGHTLHADAAYYRSDKIEVDSLDLDAVSVAVGSTWNFGRLSVTPKLRAGFFWLDGNDYLQTLGGELELLMRFRPDFRGYVVLRGDDEDFSNVPDFQSAALRSGRRISAQPGVVWNISPTMSLKAEALLMDKKGAVACSATAAVSGCESYDRYGGNLQHTWLHGRGAFTLLGVWAERSDYDGVDAFVSPTIVREEWLYRARATAGAPLSFFAPGMELPEFVSDINLVAQYEYETVDSNIVNFDYDTHKVSVLLSKRIAF